MSNSMHNFHRVREALFRKKKRTRSDDDATSEVLPVSVENTDKTVLDVDEDEDESSDEDSLCSNTDTQYYDPWIQKLR